MVRAADPKLGAEAVNPLVAGSIPAGGANTSTGEPFASVGEILTFALWMQKQGYQPTTVSSAAGAKKVYHRRRLGTVPPRHCISEEMSCKYATVDNNG